MWDGLKPVLHSSARLVPDVGRARPRRSLLDPRRAIGLDELLRSFAAGQAHPHRTSLALDAQVDDEEGAAAALLLDPFGQQRECLPVGRESELIAVLQLAYAAAHRPQHGSELVEVAGAPRGGEAIEIARERRLFGRRDQSDSENEK